MEIKKCCFLGHRKINFSERFCDFLKEEIENLILKENISHFLFGSKSEFNDLCYNIVSDLKNKYPHIERIYVRAEYPFIDDTYEKYLLSKYESSFYPSCVLNSGKACYIKRNYYMIDSSDICVLYFERDEAKIKKSGTFLDINISPFFRDILFIYNA